MTQRILSHCLRVFCTCNTFWRAGPPKKARICTPLKCFAFGMNLAKLSFLSYLREKVENQSYIFLTSYLVLSALQIGLREIQEKDKKWSFVYIWHQPAELIFTERSLCGRQGQVLTGITSFTRQRPCEVDTVFNLILQMRKMRLEKRGDLPPCQVVIEMEPGSKSYSLQNLSLKGSLKPNDSRVWS